jgi:hypothetical protein
MTPSPPGPRRRPAQRPPGKPHPRLWFGAFGVFAVLFFVYAAVPADALPVFLPGHAARSHAHLVGDAMVVAVLAIIALACAIGSAESVRARRRAQEPIRIDVADQDWKPKLYR